jgi:hypothetical protein
MNKVEQALARGLCTRLAETKGLSFEYDRPSIEEAKRLTAKYRPWYTRWYKVDWDAIIDAAIAPTTVLSVYKECLEERRKRDVRF